MGFQTPLYELSDYLDWTNSGKLQLPDFQRGYKWDDERIRQLLVTILKGHPLGVVMLLKTGNSQIRFKPRPVEGVALAGVVEPEALLLDGQQRLTSLTQALSGEGVVDTTDSRGKKMSRKYYVDMETALRGEDWIDDAVLSVPADGVVKSAFGRVVEVDYSTPEKEQAAGVFPLRLLFKNMDMMSWIFACPNQDIAKRFAAELVAAAGSYNIPAIELDKETSKSAVATVFEKVNTGGLGLNAFELLTATFAGDKQYFDEHDKDFRLNDDWHETRLGFSAYPVLSELENTDFLQAVTLLTTLKRNKQSGSGRAPGVSVKREDILKLTLSDYLEWVNPLREAFVWVSNFLADLHIFEPRFIPYRVQLVPLAVIRVVLGADASLIGVREKLTRWFWCGILGELYGGATATRFVRDVEQVPAWARGEEGAAVPSTLTEASFVESRLHSLRTRNAAAYKGIYALILGSGARDWMEDIALDKVQYSNLAVDIHHIFPQKWCADHGIDEERRESIVNKTSISARTNRTIGGVAPSAYLAKVERLAQLDGDRLDGLLSTHLVPAQTLRADDFDTFFAARREALCVLVEAAMGKSVPRDLARGMPGEDSSMFEDEEVKETVEELD
ncbi:DUF262 domain-containing protein [Micrococcales bacterium 31B]|nr:DUF262 domain-containing protein [Micrococcales bacterium 31B]